jgi:hypothetical protein
LLLRVRVRSRNDQATHHLRRCRSETRQATGALVSRRPLLTGPGIEFSNPTGADVSLGLELLAGYGPPVDRRGLRPAEGFSLSLPDAHFVSALGLRRTGSRCSAATGSGVCTDDERLRRG